MTEDFSRTKLATVTLTTAIAALQGVRGMVWSRDSLQMAERIAAAMATGGRVEVPEAVLARLATTTTHSDPTAATDVTLLVGMAAVYGIAAGIVTRANLAGLAVTVGHSASGLVVAVARPDAAAARGVAA